MKILLINPPRHNEIGGSTPAVLEKNRGFNPPLGILFIAAVLEKEGYDVRVIDCQVEEYDYDQVEEVVREAEYDLIGLTVMTFSLIDSSMVTELAKKHHPDKPVVWGGPHLHIYPRETAQFPDVDYVCPSEGEEAILNLVRPLPVQRGGRGRAGSRQSALRGAPSDALPQIRLNPREGSDRHDPLHESRLPVQMRLL